MIYVLIAFLMGLLVPVQTAANSRLRMTVGQAYLSTLVSFSVSSLSLLLIALVAGIPLLPSAELASAAPWWSWLGGIIALATITIAIYLFKELGQLQAMIVPLFCQLLFSLLIDSFGWFGSSVIPMSVKRGAGAVLLFVGIFFVSVLPKLREQKDSPGKRGMRQWLWQGLAILSGCGMASIGAIYARLGVILNSPFQASMISFFIATVAMLLFCLFKGGIKDIGKAFGKGNPWWMWLGGICGAITVYGNAWLIPKLGVGLFVMLILVGQLIVSLLMESKGWLGAPKKKIAVSQIVGLVVMVAGVALIRL